MLNNVQLTPCGFEAGKLTHTCEAFGYPIMGALGWKYKFGHQ